MGRAACGLTRKIASGKFGVTPGGGNSTVESHSSKVMVAGSNPVPRSKGCKEVWCVYALRSKRDDGLYVGMSSDVKSRLEYHNRGYNRSTRARMPFELVYAEECSSRLEARKREKYLKSGIGREF